ncbi:MAG TPA: nucleotide exchange factor GrpE [Candidatus Absconditabacterales bacterium]|nr:nucleotide exchange factor GrpE [Candidatus Absconditabacterales bacterium]
MTDKDLQEKLQQAEQENKKKSKSKKDKKLEAKLEKLQKEYDEQTEMLKRAQHDYINLKFDFDRFQKQVEEKEKEGELNSLISSVKKFLPFVEDLRKSLDNIPKDKKSEPLAQGVQLVYDNFLKTLKSMNIKQIEAVGLEPDSLLHEPVSVQPVEDKKMKGKIVQEFERGFIYKKDDKQVVLNTSKVIVGQ